MAITDIDISEELVTNAPSIKYTGNEGPKSPQEEQMMMMQQMEEMDQIENQEADSQEMMMAEIDILKDEYLQYVYEMREMGRQPMSFSEFRRMIIGEAKQGLAFGGMVGSDGRRRYGLGSSLKKFVRKVIPNEVAEIAVKAAPFVAPFNPLAAGLMSGIGSFDQTGRIGSSLKSGLTNYALGQGARYLGGADFQGLQNPFTRDAFSMPTGSGGIKELFKTKAPANVNKIAEPNSIEGFLTKGKAKELGLESARIGELASQEFAKQNAPTNIKFLDKLTSFIPKSTLGKVALGGGALALGTALLGGGPEETVSTIMDRGEGLDLDSIRLEVREAFKDPSGKKLAALRNKYPYLGTQASKNISAMADGGRAGYANGDIVLTEKSKVSPAKVNQIEGNKMAEAAINDILYRFYEKFPGVDASGMSIEDMVAELQAEAVLGQEGLGIMGLDRSMDMITPESVKDNTRRIMMGDTQFGDIGSMKEQPETEYERRVKAALGYANGGRIGFDSGGGFSANDLLLLKRFKMNPKEVSGYKDGGKELLKSLRTSYVPKAEGGLMDLGGMEKDYRNEGGFVPIGEYEKKDDVPARLSLNEFVMTADAVRGAGNGDIDKGAGIMENIMNLFENKGKAMGSKMMNPMKSKIKPEAVSMPSSMKSGYEDVLEGAMASVGQGPEPMAMQKQVDKMSENLRPEKSIMPQMRMAGPDWYIKRVEHLLFLGYDYDEASRIAYDSDEYYGIVGDSDFMGQRKGAEDMFEVSERLSEVV
jgi:hypothetical protein